MELRQLEHFLSVVEEGSFTAAAARVYMVQSSLSASLLALERDLGTTLFIRGRRGAELTDAGRAFLAPARAMVEQAGRARDAVAEVEGLLRGTVRVAFVVPPRIIDVVQTLRGFHQEHPGVQVRLLPADARTAPDLVASGQVDFALAPRTDRPGSTLRFDPLVHDQLVVLCPAGHRLAGARDVHPRELIGEAVIDLPRAQLARQLFDSLLAEHGLQREIRLEVDTWLGVLALVHQGMGISYGPASSANSEVFGRVDVATLADAPLWELGIVYRDEALRGAAGRAFLTAFRRALPGANRSYPNVAVPPGRLPGRPVLEQSLPRLLGTAADLAKTSVPGAAEVSVTLLVENQATTVASTGQLALELDACQYEQDDGPCLHAARSGEPTEIPDSRTEPRWPAYARSATGHGALSVLSVPLVIDADGPVTGSLNIYATGPQVFGSAGRAAAARVADFAAAAAGSASAYRGARNQVENLRTALTSRAVIEQAKGILMERGKLTAEQAFRALSEESMAANVKVRVLAEQLVLTGQFPDRAPTARTRSPARRRPRS
ncbi:LysR substrate-binding domain-containing protein [Geodermatophilus ruber]|uniref:LysR substrate-binding domain-containing protein n=1 Tax=Geodermatophilus ruber TaxID=504800 RepID=UPI001160D6B6|nr:LysR substrate-binding domain-containing protein [Geodermatophilus ruber]